MSVQENKRIAETILNALSNRDMTTVLDHMHDEGTWSIPYRKDLFPSAGTKGKKIFGESIGQLLGAFSAFRIEPMNIIGEGDTVAVLAKSDAAGPKGEPYQNIYMFHFLFRDGKAHTVLEFFDPFQVIAFKDKLA